MYKDIIWDFDGTLFDTYPGMVYAFKLALQDEGIVEEENNILNFMKISMGEAIKHYRTVYNLGEDFEGRMKKYDKEVGLNKVRPFPYAEDICKWIISTGRRNYILTHRGGSTHKILQSYNMEQYFTEIVTKQNGYKRKPDPEGYLYLMDKYNMNKENTIIVGDRELEVISARSAGVKACLYNTNDIIFTAEPDYLIDSLREVKGICMGSNH